MRRAALFLLLAATLGAEPCPGTSPPPDPPGVVQCSAQSIRTPGTSAASELRVTEAAGTLGGGSAVNVALGFRVASAELAGGVPVQNALITIAVRTGSAQLGSSSLTTDANGLAGTTGTFQRDSVVFDVTAMLPNNGGEANKSPAAVCLKVVDPS